MEKEAVIEGTAAPAEKKRPADTEVSGEQLKPARKKGRFWLVLLGIFVALLACTGVLVGLAFGAGLLLPASSELAKDIAEIPAIDRILPAKTRAEIAFAKYEEVMGEETPRESMINYTQSSDDFPGIGSYELTVTATGRSDGSASTVSVDASMDIGGFVGEASLDTVAVIEDAELYIRINSAPEALYRLIAEGLAEDSGDREAISAAADNYRTELENVWYVFSPDDMLDLADQIEGFEFDESDYLSAIQELNSVQPGIQNPFEDVEYTFIAAEKVRGIESYEFDLKVDEHELEEFLKDLYTSTNDLEMENLDLRVWIDKDGRVIKESLSADMMLDDVLSQLEFSAEYWNFGDSKEIEIPLGAKTIKYLARLFGADVLGISDKKELEPPEYPVD